MKNATARRLYIKKSRMMKSNTLHIKPLVFHVATALAALQGGFLFSSVAWAAPTGSQVVAGSASIGVSGATTIVNQGSNRAIINWKNFNVGSGETVRFIAPNTASATLNRVVGSLPSSINGLVQGNGRVFLINPNGILVGQGGAINVQGGFVASTGNISDSAFMQGGAMVLSGDKGQIQVLGTISASGGYYADCACSGRGGRRDLNGGHEDQPGCGRSGDAVERQYYGDARQRRERDGQRSRYVEGGEGDAGRCK